MPTLHHQDKLNDYLYLGVQIGKGVTGKGYKTGAGASTNKGQGVWTARIKFPKQAVVYRSTGIKYSPEDEQGKRLAAQKAFTIFSTYSDKFSRGEDYTRVNYISNVSERYKAYVDKCSTENEVTLLTPNATPAHRILGGKTYWTDIKARSSLSLWKNYLDGFVKQLPKQHKQDPSPVIERIDPRELDKLDDWIVKRNPLLAIETRLKIITELRHFLHWCYHERYIDSVHQVRRPERGGVQGARARMRKEITPEMYREMVDYTRARYMEKDIDIGEKEYAYIFHLWFLIMSNCGIRVPTGGVDHTLVRWEHLKKTTFKGKEQWTLKRTEKLHTYEAIILEPSFVYWTALEKLYIKLGIDTTKGYVFCHPFDEYKNNKVDLNLKKGAPIKSFKARWETMCGQNGLGYNPASIQGQRTTQNQRVSPSSCRAWFITQRLYSSDDIKIELLARVCGTSIGQIEARYLRLDMARSYEYLSAGAYDARGKLPVYDDDGYYVGRK